MQTIFYVTKNGKRLNSADDFPTEDSAWRWLRKTKCDNKESLRNLGYAVKRKTKTDESDGDIAEAIAGRVIGKEKAGLLRGIARFFKL